MNFCLLQLRETLSYQCLTETLYKESGILRVINCNALLTVEIICNSIYVSFH